MACVEGAIVVGDKVGDIFCVLCVNDGPLWLHFSFLLVVVYDKLTSFVHLCIGIFKANHYALRTGDRVRCWTKLDGRVCP